MANKAVINPTPGQTAIRSIGRVKTLRAAIAKNQARGNAEKVSSLQAELDRRLSELGALKELLDNL